MKKFISLLLTLAMVLSLAVPALAAEPAVTGEKSGEVSGTYNPTVAITGVSLIVDGTTYTEGDVTITPDSTVTLTVTGTNLQYGTNDHRVQFASGMNVPIISDYFTFSDDGTTATGDVTASNFSNSSNHKIVYYNDYTSVNRTPISTGIYVTYDSGIAEEDKAVITGVSITVDGIEYTSGNVTVYSDSTVTLTVTGTNLQNGTVDNYVRYGTVIGESLNSGYFRFSDDGTTATQTLPISFFADESNTEIRYSNSYGSDEITWVSTGIYVTYNEGTKPVPTNVTFNAMLKAVDSQGSEVTGVAGYLDGDRVMFSTHGTYPDTSTGTHTIGGFVVNTEVYKLPANIILTVTDDGNGNGILTTESTHASITTETIDGQTVYVITVTLEEEIAEPQAKWGTSVDNLTGSGTLAEAIAAAEADSGITYIQLQSDVTTENGYDISSGVFTLDLNGKTLSSAAYTITVRYSGTMVTLTDSATGGAVTSTGEGYAAVSPVSNGKVVFNGGSYSGEEAINFMEGGIAEIHGGTFTGTYGYAVNVAVDSTLSIAGGTFSGPWASVTTSGTTTITGGTFTAGSEGHITYISGTLDLSGYDTEKLNGLTLSQWTNADLTVSDENIELPAGYVFQDSKGTTVTTLDHETVYTIAPENAEPTYTITVDKYGEGTVEVPATAAEGETVTVTLNPAEGYTALNFQIKQTDNYKEVDFTKVNDTTYTFVMPAGNVVVFANFCLPGTKLDTIYYKGPWTNVRFEFINSAGFILETAAGTLKETGIYAVSDIPEWSYSLIIRNLDDVSEHMNAGDIPTDGRNMYNAETDQWEIYTPSQPPEEVTSAEITWGSMAFTYTEGENGAEGAWSADTGDAAGTVTVENTGTAAITASAAYTPKEGYTEIEGTLGDAQTLAAGEEATFTLTLTGKPGKSIPAGTKIGTVTVTIK